MRRNLLVSLALTALLGAALVSTLAWSLPKSTPGCPRQAPKDGSPCKHKHADCHWRCEGEGHSDLGCSCEKDEHGTWRWQCANIGPPCVL
jgi:hypothetical protein